MSRLRRDLAGATDGAAALEFALVAPLLIGVIIGIIQLGIMFLANAGLQQAVEAGARYATIYPRPNDAQISSKVLAGGYGLRKSGIVGPKIAHGTSDGTPNGTPYIDISMSYSMSLNFIFYEMAPIKLTHSRRAYQV